jgi:hypothetical protein
MIDDMLSTALFAIVLLCVVFVGFLAVDIIVAIFELVLELIKELV